MPRFKDAPIKMNSMMEKVYVAARMKGMDKKRASMMAIGVAKKKFKKKGGKWLGKK